MLAGALATLDDLAPGRAFCGLGVGAGLEPLDIDYPKPVAALRQAVADIRTLLGGGEVGGERLVRPSTHPVPLSIGTRSPQVMPLAGEVADIAIVGAPEECADQLGVVLDMGFTSASLNLAATARPSAAEGLAETITSFAPVVASLVED